MTVDWKKWGKRFRELAKENGWTLAKIADRMEITDGALRHWTNGTRDPNLGDFFRMCEIAGVDPARVLFNAPIMSDAIKSNIDGLAKAILDADPATSPGYAKMARGLRMTSKTKV